MIENIDKPALSGLWPSKKGMSVVLDLGANIECSDKNLIDFSIMGSSLFNSLFPEEKAKVALLNIGSEEVKGNEVIKETYKKLNQISNEDFEFKGFIEGNSLMNGEVNVIVADGFTGNVALKTAEGTANFITSELKSAMKGSIFGKLGSIISMRSLNKFKKKLQENHIEITPEMMARGAITQMKIHKNSRKHVPPPPQHAMGDRPPSPRAPHDSAWLDKVKHVKNDK